MACYVGRFSELERGSWVSRICVLFDFFVAVPAAVPAACRGKVHRQPSAAGHATAVPADNAVRLASMASHGKLRDNVHGNPHGKTRGKTHGKTHGNAHGMPRKKQII